MLEIINILKGKTKEIIVHGPKKSNIIIIDLNNSSSVDVKAFGYLLNALYSKNKNYKLSLFEEVIFYNDIIASCGKKRKFTLSELSPYKAYIFNNRYELAA